MSTKTVSTIYPPLTKTVKQAFGKEVYLLGRWTDGYTFWLQAPSWDCGWYWGLGYVETFTRTEGPPAKDIQAHQHYDGIVFTKSEHYDSVKQAFVYGDYMYILSDNPRVMECVLSKSEQWLLSEYMKTAYTLQESAELFGRGFSHVSTPPVPLVKDEALAKRINEVELPNVFAAIRALLTP